MLQANEVCESFDMILASPKSQSEYDELLTSVKKMKHEMKRLLIGVYKSEIGTGDWINAGGKKIPYNLDWPPGQPDNPTYEHYLGIESILTKLSRDFKFVFFFVVLRIL